MKYSFFLKYLSVFYLLMVNGLSAQNRFITIDSTQVHIKTIGVENRKEGEPVIVFESGAGTPMGHWERVLEGVSELAPLVTYERAGIGKSENSDYVPTMKNVSDRLVKILKHLDLEPPYVLVGHSLGGLYVRGFAKYYPEKLAGLVIIDPADFTENQENIRDHYEVTGLSEAKVDSLIQLFIDKRKTRSEKAPEGIKKESQVLEALRANDFKELKDSPLPNVPVHILTGGRFDLPTKFHSKEYDEEALFRSKMKHRVNRWMEVVQTVDKGMLFYSGDAGHFVHYDDPELLISSIRMVLQDYKLLKK